jgi:hypothetical protein
MDFKGTNPAGLSVLRDFIPTDLMEMSLFLKLHRHDGMVSPFTWPTISMNCSALLPPLLKLLLVLLLLLLLVLAGLAPLSFSLWWMKAQCWKLARSVVGVVGVLGCDGDLVTDQGRIGPVEEVEMVDMLSSDSEEVVESRLNLLFMAGIWSKRSSW